MDCEFKDITEITDCLNVRNFMQSVPTEKNNLSCLHINIRSLIKYFAALQECLVTSRKMIDVIVVTEANISPTLSCLYHLNGYHMLTELRNNRKGGGIIMYVHKKHKFTVSKCTTQHFENISCHIVTPTKYSATLLAIYRPPSYSKHLFINELDTFLQKINKSNDIFLVGDVNINLKLNCPVKHKYNTTLYNHGLSCGITQYTRIEKVKNKITKSCIDHIYARSRTQDVYTAALATKLADHRATVFACIGVSHIRDVPKFKIIYDRNKLSTHLREINWMVLKCTVCPNKLYAILANNIRSCYEKSKIKIKHSNNFKNIKNKWINKKILNACDYRDKIFLQWLKDKTNQILKLKYNRARNYANKIIQTAKNKQIKNDIVKNKNNSRNLWRILNEITGRIKNSVDTTIMNAMESTVQKISDISNNFALSFRNAVRNIIPNCNKKILEPSSYRRPVDVSIRYQKATCQLIKKIISSLNNNKAPGIDQIRSIDLKMLNDSVASTIARFINISIDHGQYPPELKTGIVRPIHKNGSCMNYENYRPITILPVIDKIAEKYICRQIINFYNTNDILAKSQFGFQPQKSTTQLLSNFTDSISCHLNDRKHILVVFIDYSKAFDTLRHDVLLEKLDDCGIRGPLKNWCQNYLEDRSFYVNVSGQLSDKVNVTEGTAQGSVLGPLHYLTYVNDVENLIKKCEIYQFADDTCLLAAHKDINEALRCLQHDFTLLTKWSHDVGLVLNSNKTKLMYISSSKNRVVTPLSLIAHNHACLHTDQSDCVCEALELVKTQRYLGLVIDDRLTWKDHINHVCDKLRAILAKFAIIRNKIPFQTLLSLYVALGESIISYGLSSYGRSCKTNLNLIYQLQLRILKTIVPYKVKINHKNNYHDLFHYCKILPIHEKIQYTLLVENFFNKNFQSVVSHNIITRSVTNNLLEIPRYNNLHGKNQLNYQIPKLINALPQELKVNLTTRNIKTKIKSYFLNK